MARPPLPLGSWGKIRTVRPVTGSSWRAITNYRGFDGKTTRVERRANSETKAIANLKEALKKQPNTSPSGKLSSASRVKDAAAEWLRKTRIKRDAVTCERYESRWKNHVQPALGELLLRECTVARLTDFFDELSMRLAANTCRGIRSVVSGIMATAVLHEVIEHNPALELEHIEGSAVRAKMTFNREQILLFLADLDGDTNAARADLPDLIRFFSALASASAKPSRFAGATSTCLTMTSSLTARPFPRTQSSLMRTSRW